jgi:CoA:oxalate CoA-transferase
MDAPLKGIRVIDWTIWQQGPVATTMLADMGAEVIKIEERDKGDPGRSIFAIGGSAATAKSGHNFYFEANNRHKQSLTLNLSKPEAREIVYRLAAKSDVFVQNFRKGVADRLGLGYKDLAAHNPKLVYASSSGYGPTGPDSGEPSFDYLAQSRSGIMNIASVATEDPIYLNGGLADQMGAIMLAYGVMTALVARERYGIGQEVNASHLGSMIALQGLNVSSTTILGHEFPRSTRDDAYNPLWNHYKCADGKWLSLGMLQTDRYWKDFCVALGVPELIDDPRFNGIKVRGKNHRELVAILDNVFHRQAARRMDGYPQARRRFHLYAGQHDHRFARRRAGPRERIHRRLRPSGDGQDQTGRRAGHLEQDARQRARAGAGTWREHRNHSDGVARV